MSSSTTQKSLNRQLLHRRAIGILNANFLHFIPFSLLFLPLTFSISATIQFYYSISSDFNTTTYFDPPILLLIKTIITSSQTFPSLKTLVIILAFIFFVILPTVAGIGLITYSTNQAMYHKHLTFSSTVKSLSHSYIPLLSTVVAGTVKLIILSLTLTLSPIAISEAIKSLGLQFDDYLFLIFINKIASYVLACGIVFFMVIWGSGPAIAVLELKSGFEPLRRSANQSAEFRSHSFSIVFISGFIVGSMLLDSGFVQINEPATNWISILKALVICLLSSLMILHYVVANTVLYVQSKAECGEESVKTAVEGEVSGEYVRVVVNEEDEKVTRELPNDQANGGFTYILYGYCVFWFVLILPPVLNTIRDNMVILLSD